MSWLLALADTFRCNIMDLEQFSEDLRLYCPFRVAYKDSSWRMKLLGWLLEPINPTFMTEYTTTLGHTVWFPNKGAYEAEGGTLLAHEFVHLWDKADSPWWFTFSYLMPQIFILPGLISVLALWCFGFGWLGLGALFLVGLLALLPSPWRVFWELRGYTMTMAFHYWTTGKHLSVIPLSNQFTSWAYWRMSNDGSVIRERLLQAQADIASGELQKHGPYRAVYSALKKAGLLHV